MTASRSLCFIFPLLSSFSVFCVIVHVTITLLDIYSLSVMEDINIFVFLILINICADDVGEIPRSIHRHYLWPISTIRSGSARFLHGTFGQICTSSHWLQSPRRRQVIIVQIMTDSAGIMRICWPELCECCPKAKLDLFAAWAAIAITTWLFVWLSVCLLRWYIVRKRLGQSSCDFHQIVAHPFYMYSLPIPNMNPIAGGISLIEGVKCWGYIILTVMWRPLVNTFVQAFGRHVSHRWALV